MNNTNKFIKELESGEIHFRDKWQFELKSDFVPLPELKKNIYTQEFYFFIPNSFQINSSTYTRDDFYRDQTNLIRFKTPEFTLSEILDTSNDKSPLVRITEITEDLPSDEATDEVENELKLLGNIIRSSLRERVRTLIEELGQLSTPKEITLYNREVQDYCEQVKELRATYFALQTKTIDSWSRELHSHFLYVDEFISSSINYYLSGLLQDMRKSENSEALTPADRVLCQLLTTEKKHREEQHQEPQKIDEGSLQNEFIFYRNGLLNKYVIDALLLNTNRSSLTKRFRNVIGALSAGIAMLVFFILFVWQGEIFAINSQPFILTTVVLYILKDRIKEGLRTISYKKASKWFSDYTTDIRSGDNQNYFGKINESFSFVREKDISKEISNIRNQAFHAVLEKFKRPERVIYYKRTVELNQQTPKNDTLRRHDFNIIFRFNILAFLPKLANPHHSYITLDPDTLDFSRVRLPKVYHLNIILRNTYLQEDQTQKVELKKFRLIIDKNGIKRVEQVSV